ncbi:MAG: DUF58 domain-containing protein [Microbacterium sp.]
MPADPPTLAARTASDSGATARTRVTTARRGALVSLVVAATAASRRVREAAAAAGVWLGQTVTPAGWLVLAAATGGVAGGWAFGWVEWLVAGVASLVLAAMCLPFLFGARAYDVVVRLAHERVVAGGEVPGEIDIRNRGTRTALPGRIDLPVGDGLVELGVPFLRGGHVVSQPVSIPTPHRGIIPVGPATAVRTDPIGLLRREHAWDDVHELYVHPRTVVVPSTSAGLVRDLEGQPTRLLVDADMSFHAIREYAPGDSRRQIHWKSTAKTGQLMVRQFEESRRSRMAVVLSLAEADYADDDEFELAVSAAASLALQAMRDGRDLDVVTGTAIPRVVKGRLRAIQTLSAPSPRALLDGFSGLGSLEHTMRLEEVCRLAVESSDALSIAFVVCGSRVGLTRLRQAALAFPDETAVIAVACDERAHPRLRPIGSLTLLTIGVLDDLAGLMLRGAQS